MTVTFMSLLAATMAERIHPKLGARLLAPLIFAGLASVFYRKWTGSLWPCAGGQFYSSSLIALMIWRACAERQLPGSRETSLNRCQVRASSDPEIEGVACLLTTNYKLNLRPLPGLGW